MGPSLASNSPLSRCPFTFLPHYHPPFLSLGGKPRGPRFDFLSDAHGSLHGGESVRGRAPLDPEPAVTCWPRVQRRCQADAGVSGLRPVPWGPGGI